MYVSTSSASRSNLLKTIRFENPDYIPMTFHINEACWDAYDPDALLELAEQHPFLFPDVASLRGRKGHYAKNARVNEPYTDDFGCVWRTAMNGILGSVHDHPLLDWNNYASYQMPDPELSDGLGPIDWKEFEEQCRRQRALGEAVYGDLRHGHTFLQLCDLRGYENLLVDMADEEPLLDDLIARLEAFNLAQIRHFIEADVDIVRIPEDLGMQYGPMLSIHDFETYIQPSYRKMISLVHNAGKLVHMHSDGDIRLLADGIVCDGVDVLNLQDLVNGVDWIAQKYGGKLCIDLDIDRQRITPFGTPDDIDALIREEVEKIGRREGGLMMIYGLYPGVPLENIKALMDAMERYAFYFSM